MDKLILNGAGWVVTTWLRPVVEAELTPHSWNHYLGLGPNKYSGGSRFIIYLGKVSRDNPMDRYL